MAGLTLVLLVLSALRRTAPVNDPRSIAGIASLCADSTGNLLRRPSQGPDRRRSLRHTVGSSTFSIHQTVTAQGRQTQAIDVLQPSSETMGAASDSANADGSQRFPLRGEMLQLGTFALILTGIWVLILYYKLTSHDTAFERFMSGQSFGPRFLFTSLGVVVSFVWLRLFQGKHRQ